VSTEGAHRCRACSREAAKRHYHRVSLRILQRYHETKSMLTQPELEQRRARAYLAEYVKRGRVERKPCQSCGSIRATGIQMDLTRPLEVSAWACRLHRGRLQAELEVERLGEQPLRLLDAACTESGGRTAAATWALDFEEVVASLDTLEPAVVASIREAARSVGSLRISAESPLYAMRLVQCYRERLGLKD